MKYNADWLFLAKTNTINPSTIADLSVYSCIIPILIFLILKFNWKEKLKWFCFLLLLVNFLTDLASGFYSKKPSASGTVLNASPISETHSVTIKLDKGNVHEGEFIQSQNFAGIITKIYLPGSREPQIEKIDIHGNNAAINAAAPFRVFSTLKITNISMLVNIILTFFIFYLIFKGINLWERFSLVALATAIAVWVVRNIILNQLHSFDGFFNGGSTILIILFALAFFYFQLNKPDIPFIYSSPTFWIVTAILLYKAGTFFLFLYANTLDQSEKVNFFLINSAFYDLQNFLFAIAFFIPGVKKNKHSSKSRLATI